MRTGIVIQARMGSTRFPGKVLEKLCGATMLEQLVDRLTGITGIDKTIVATSDRSLDDAIASLCADHDIACFRGSEQDVLGRYRDAAEVYSLDVILRACADAPLTDPPGIMKLLQVFGSRETQFVHNRHPDGWPLGTSADLMARSALELAATDATLPQQREHVVPYLWEHAVEFKECKLESPPELRRPHYSFTVDYPKDLEILNGLCEELKTPFQDLQLSRIITYLDENSIWGRRFRDTEHTWG